jgi:hypothetical protein
MQNLATMKMSCFNVINAKQKHAKQEMYSKAGTNAGAHLHIGDGIFISQKLSACWFLRFVQGFRFV